MFFEKSSGVRIEKWISRSYSRIGGKRKFLPDGTKWVVIGMKIFLKQGL